MHTKTISQASKTGWLESKLYALIDFIMGKVEIEHKEESPMRALVSAVECTHTFPSEVECYITVTGRKSLRVVQFETAIGGNGEPVKVAINSFAQDPKYKQCGYCEIYMTPVDYYRHIGLGNPNEILGRNDRLPAIPQCTKRPKSISLNKAVLVNGEYRELFKEAPKMTSFRPEDAEDQIAYPEDLENPGLKDKPANGLTVKIKDLQQYGWIPSPADGHSCKACQAGEAIEGVCWSYKRLPEIGYEHMDELGRITRIIGTKERLVLATGYELFHKHLVGPNVDLNANGQYDRWLEHLKQENNLTTEQVLKYVWEMVGCPEVSARGFNFNRTSLPLLLARDIVREAMSSWIHLNTHEKKESTVGPTAMIRFVRDSYNGVPNDYFSVELNGKLRRFSLEENYQSDFHPMGRFAGGITEHRLCHNGECVALIDVKYSIHSGATMVRASNLNGELIEFFLPHTHEFFKYVVVEATVSEIMQ